MTDGITAVPATDVIAAGAMGGEVSSSELVSLGPAPQETPADDSPRLGRNLRALAGGQVVTWTMTLLWTLVVPRALGPAGLGIVVSALAVSGVLGLVLGLGTRSYLVREIVLDPATGPKLIGTAIVMKLLLAPLVGLAAVVFADLSHYGHDAKIALYLASAMTVLTILAEPLQAGFQAIERMQYLAYADIINKSAQSVIGIALVLVGFRADGIVANMAIFAGVVLLLNALWLRRFIRIDLRTNARMIGNMTRQSLAYWASGMFGLIYMWIDTVMLTLMTRSEVVGWYGATTTLFQTFLFIPVLVATAWLPRLVSAFDQSRAHMIKTARTPLEFVLVISIPVAAGIALVASPMVHALYGHEFGHAVPVLIVLAACIPPMYVNILLDQVLVAAKRQVVWTMVMIGAAFINPLFNLVLIPATESRYHNGAIGAAVSLVLTEVLMDIVGLVMVGHEVLNRGSIKRCALAIVACASMLGVAYAARPLGTPVALIAGGVTLVLLTVKLRIATKDEVAMLRAGLARLPRPRLARL